MHRTGGNFSGLVRFVAVLTMVALAATACGSNDGDKVVEWSLAEPLTRDDVGLGSLEATADDTFPDRAVESAGAGSFMTVRLELPDDGEPLELTQARVAAANLSRNESFPAHDVTITTAEHTLEEAEALIVEHAERFNLDTSRLAAWRTEAEAFLDNDDLDLVDLNLNGGHVGYLDVAMSAKFDTTRDDVSLQWFFSWEPEF